MVSGSSAGMAALAASLALASPAVAAPDKAQSRDVAVALIDVGANALYSKDPNVSFVDLTPSLRPGDHHARGRVGSVDHGDVVAQAFVQEYRRLDPDARITFYTVNPFVQRGVTGPMMFSRSMLQQALPRMKDANVRVAITTFGVSDQAAGDRVLKDIQDAGMVVFAATPNHKEDYGIWPAANPTTIAVADGVTPDSGFRKNRSWGKWVDFVADGNFHSGTIDTDGSSFATPRVAAYGAYYASMNAQAGVDDMRRAISAASVTVRINDRDFAKVGGDRGAQLFLERMSRNSGDVQQADVAPARRTALQAVSMQGGMGH